jgi:hypothetical protein
MFSASVSDASSPEKLLSLSEISRGVPAPGVEVALSRALFAAPRTPEQSIYYYSDTILNYTYLRSLFVLAALLWLSWEVVCFLEVER